MGKNGIDGEGDSDESERDAQGSTETEQSAICESDCAAGSLM